MKRPLAALGGSSKQLISSVRESWSAVSLPPGLQKQLEWGLPKTPPLDHFVMAPDLAEPVEPAAGVVEIGVAFSVERRIVLGATAIELGRGRVVGTGLEKVRFGALEVAKRADLLGGTRHKMLLSVLPAELRTAKPAAVEGPGGAAEPLPTNNGRATI